jgi:hypothetical protein
MSRPKIPTCPGLKITANAGVFFTDSLGRVHDLERDRVLRPKEAAADPRLGGAPVSEVLRMVRGGTLYPVFKRNARVILIFDCALTDWRARLLAAQPLRHLGATRAQRVA